MKIVFFLLLMTGFVPAAQAQGFAGLEKSKPLEIPVYEPIDNGLMLLKLPTGFAESVFLDEQTKQILQNAEIFNIDLVYTEYPAGNNFEALNRRRFNWLVNNLPKNWGDGRPVVRLVRQTLAKNQKDAGKMFHGFAIYYRQKPSAELLKTELEYIKTIISKPDKTTDEDSCFSKNKSKRNHFILRRDKDSLYIFCYDSIAVSWLKKKSLNFEILTPNELYRKGYLPPGEKAAYFGNCFSLVVTSCMPPPPAKAKTPFEAENPIDNTVLKALSRNNWTDMLICVDVTGSMSPYTAQVAAWLQVKSRYEKLRYFIAFNDGDGMADDKKEPGKTGGIYGIRPAGFNDVSETIYKAMKAGSGGDIPENDMEALLQGINTCTDCKQVILVADNRAPVRDMALLSAIKKPVTIILCGLKNSHINIDLLNIARATGGSLHTTDEDLVNVTTLKEGEAFSYQGISYRVVKGVFVNEGRLKGK
jgi:hypothetical protein